MTNEMSFESLYSQGLGISRVDNSNITSCEAFDGFDDGIDIELAHAMESLEFLDTYAALDSKLTSDKVRMCKKLSVTYGLKSGVNKRAAESVESLCQSQIHSLEEEAAAENPAENAEAPKTEPAKKKQNFLKTIWGVIKNVFIAIGNFFKKIWDSIVKFFSRFKKVKDPIPEEVVQEIIKMGSSSSSSSSSDEKIVAFDLKVFRGNTNLSFKMACDWAKDPNNLNDAESKLKDLKNAMKTFNEVNTRCVEIADFFEKMFSKDESAIMSDTNKYKTDEDAEKAGDTKALVASVKFKGAKALAPVCREFAKVNKQIGTVLFNIIGAFKNSYDLYNMMHTKSKSTGNSAHDDWKEKDRQERLKARMYEVDKAIEKNRYGKLDNNKKYICGGTLNISQINSLANEMKSVNTKLGVIKGSMSSNISNPSDLSKKIDDAMNSIRAMKKAHFGVDSDTFDKFGTKGKK